MALWTCRKCTTKFAVGLSMCPQCTSTDVEKEEDSLPKSTSSGGYNIVAGVEVQEETAIEPKKAGTEPSAGTSSSTPTDSPQTQASEETSSKPKSARTTVSHSKKDPTESSTAHSTATGRSKASDKEGK